MAGLYQDIELTGSSWAAWSS